MQRFEVGTKVVVPNGDVGIVKRYQEKGNVTAEGYFIKLDDCPWTLFFSEHLVKEHIDLNEKVKVGEQISIFDYF